MRRKPTPKVELLVRKLGVGVMMIELIPYSYDARELVVREAPQYGSLYTEGKRFHLVVLPGYDLDEVAEYFESYNE